MTARDTSSGTVYTCPMHPQIRRNEPGNCPICGMALEPLQPTAEGAGDAELRDMTRRFWVGTLFSVPLVVWEMQVRSEAVEVDTRLLEVWNGQAGQHVVQQAKEWPADLIVCGTHGRRGIRRIVLGSDAEYIVRRSHVPVLLVRAQATQL